MKLDILLNGQPVDAMATIVHTLKAQRVGRELVEKLKKFIDRSTTLMTFDYFWRITSAFCFCQGLTFALLDRQMFEIIIQAAIGSKVIARET